MSNAAGPLNKPGEIAGWPKLQITYRTDRDRIIDLLPPGLTVGANPFVYLNIYNVPVLGEPEYGVSTKVEADFDGMKGYYSLGLGIDQEAADLYQPRDKRPAEVSVRNPLLPPW